ncbi:NYN domain-containing protein [Ruegeria sp. R14_0]|uniref:NYN domain-containing protein n=1 Tax=Ruegeria sp. R14_0 TaxID=2821100 RepID=UPI001ADB69DF|nr:NYN domain-containing protein [Ruegeria sp. R14_0]MBO9445800.1 NYN domain-containing protein [Ruegeria sp. R14_0]
MTKRVAVLIDGDNLSPTFGDAIHQIGRNGGQVDIARVYTDAQRNSLWHEATLFQLIHSGKGKNASDLLLAIDAMELALRQIVDTVVIASSDGDFAHLHRRLREFGIGTIGLGEQKTPRSLRDSCTRFLELPQNQNDVPHSHNKTVRLPSDLDEKIQSVIAVGSKSGRGIPIADLNVRMRRLHDIKISTYPEKTWRGYLSVRKHLFELDPKGPDAHVRFRPDSFAETHQPK